MFTIYSSESIHPSFQKKQLNLRSALIINKYKKFKLYYLNRIKDFLNKDRDDDFCLFLCYLQNRMRDKRRENAKYRVFVKSFEIAT